MELLVIRHADALAEAPTDEERPLSDKGRKQSRALGHYLKRVDLVPDTVLTSPYLRAVQTAELLAEALGGCGVEQAPELACGMTPEEACDLISDQAACGRLALVGHNPDLSHLCTALCNMGAALPMKKAACAVFTLRTPRAGNGMLTALIPPKLLP